jgi:ATP-dependent Clp protease, protease subunit
MTRNKNNTDAVDQFHEYGLHIPSRTIKFELDTDESGAVEVGPVSAATMIKNLLILEHINAEPITIIMNCPGGSVTDGLAIYDAISAAKSHITIKVLGEASSMGAWILQAADERVAYPFSRIMLHEGPNSVEGHAIDVEKAVDYDKLMRFKFYKILEQRCGKTSRYWARKIARDWFLTAEQALEENLIDRIIT